LGLLNESDSRAAEILTAQGLSLEAVREEVRLQGGAGERPAQPKAAFQKLVAFLAALDQRGAVYRVSAFRGEAACVDVAIPDQRWVATFFADGHVAVEVFSASGVVEDETALSRLLDRLGPKQDQTRSPDPPPPHRE
jgi:hypothetical protein